MIQVQPQYAQRRLWEDVSRREGVFYEPIELSMPMYYSDKALFEDCCKWYEDSGRVKSYHGAFIDVNPASGDPRTRAVARSRCRASCDTAHRLGADRVVFHCSCFPFLRGAYLDNWVAACAEFYAALAEDYGIAICVENSPDIDPVPLYELMKRTPVDKVGVCLDIGHVNYSRVSLEGWFDMLGDRINYLHLSDNHGHVDDHLPLGEGNVDWGIAHSLYRQMDRDVPITLEVGGIEGVESSLGYLAQNGYFGR